MTFDSTDTLEVYPNTIVKNNLQLINTANEEISIVDYRMSCECVNMEGVKKPYILKPDTVSKFPISVNIDSSDFGRVKPITVSLKLNKAPYLISGTFTVKVLNKETRN